MRAVLRSSAPALLVLALATGLVADSHVRIVRLSLVVGAVQIKLPDGRGWRPALLDAPLVQGEQVRTLASGRAEIQFENGSTLRLIPGSQVELTRLALSDKGVFETTARISQGTAFATLRKSDSKDFRLTLPGDRWAQANGDATLRLNVAPAAHPLTVLAGKAELHDAGHPLKLKKDEAALFVAGGGARMVNVSAPAGPWTKWSEKRDQYYEAAFREGVQPGGLTSVVNWDANLNAPMPAYSGVGLNYVGTTACPWTMTAGSYSGWCWSSANGWYFPAMPPALSAQSAASASDVAQTDSVLATATASPYDVMFYGGPIGGFGAYGSSLMFGAGVGPMGAPMLCDTLCLDAYYGPNAFTDAYYMGGGYYPVTMPSPSGVPSGARTVHGPGTRLPLTRVPLSMPPTRAALSLRPPPAPRAVMGTSRRFGSREFPGAPAALAAEVRPSGIRMSHANFHVGYRALPMRSGARFGGASPPPAMMSAAPAAGAFGRGMAAGPAGGGGPVAGGAVAGGAVHGGGVVHN
jgi:hypothetical protein